MENTVTRIQVWYDTYKPHLYKLISSSALKGIMICYFLRLKFKSKELSHPGQINCILCPWRRPRIMWEVYLFSLIMVFLALILVRILAYQSWHRYLLYGGSRHLWGSKGSWKSHILLVTTYVVTCMPSEYHLISNTSTTY